MTVVLLANIVRSDKEFVLTERSYTTANFS